MQTNLYLLAITLLLCVSCKEKQPKTNIQPVAETALLEQLQAVNAERGGLLVMDVKSGKIVAQVHFKQSEEGVWCNTDAFLLDEKTEPGSLFKTASIMVALEDKVITPCDSIDTATGTFNYAGTAIADHATGGFGRITAKEALLYSSNVGIAKIVLDGYEPNPQKFIDGLAKLGFSGIPECENWSETTLPYLSFGYEAVMPVTDVLKFYNSIAKGDINCTPATLDAIRSMLVDVVEKGTGQPAKSEHIKIAGKTGTQQLGGGKHRVSFCGYFPADSPKYTCIVVIDNPRNGYPSGGTMAGSVFKTVAEQISAP